MSYIYPTFFCDATGYAARFKPRRRQVLSRGDTVFKILSNGLGGTDSIGRLKAVAI